MYNNYDNQYVAGKVIITLYRSIDYTNNLQNDLSSILKEIDYEKIEIIFHSKNNMGDIILIDLKEKHN